MKILVLLGSPRKKNSFAMAEAFIKGAERAGHDVEMLHIGRMDIKPCLGCQFCKREGNAGTCVQKDQMIEVYEKWKESDMAVFASAIYFWNFTGQMQSMITRLYALMGVKSPKKYALLLNSADEDVYTAAEYAYRNSISIFEGEDLGIFTMQGIDEEGLKQIEEFGKKV